MAHAPLSALVPADVCPMCASRELVAGRLQAGAETATGQGRFTPHRLRLFAGRRAVPLVSHNGFWACADCGCVWSRLDPAALRDVIGQRGDAVRPVAAPDTGRKAAGVTAILLLAAILLGVAVAWMTA